MIRNVYLWQNGMLMVFNETGEQMPDYQGPVEECLDRILADAPPSAEWHVGHWHGDVSGVERRRFEYVAKEHRKARTPPAPGPTPGGGG